MHGGEVPYPSQFSDLEDLGYGPFESLSDFIDGSALDSDVPHNPPQSSGISTAASGPRDDIFAHMINFVCSHFKGVFEARGLASQPRSLADLTHAHLETLANVMETLHD